MKCRRPRCPNNAWPRKNQGYCLKHYELLPATQRGYLDAAPVRERIITLRELGYGWHELSERAGKTRQGLDFIVNGTTKQVHARTWHAIMAIPVPHRVADRGALVAAVGTQRRIQALAVLGWTQKHVADLARLDPKTVSRAMSQQYVYASTAAAVATVFDRMQLTPGASHRTRERAATRGWCGPLAWDEDSIDDPAAQPNVGVAEPVGFMDRYREVREHLGLTDLEQIAKALGIAPKSVERQLERHKAEVAS